MVGACISSKKAKKTELRIDDLAQRLLGEDGPGKRRNSEFLQNLRIWDDVPSVIVIFVLPLS